MAQFQTDELEYVDEYTRQFDDHPSPNPNQQRQIYAEDDADTVCAKFKSLVNINVEFWLEIV